MSNSVFSESAELPQENHKYTAQKIKQKFLGGGVGDLPRGKKITALEDAEADILEKKREELQKELEKQLKMESQAKKSSKDLMKKHKRAPRRSTTSDSSSSSSDSSSGRKNSSSDDDSSSSSSSSSRDSRKKMLKRNIKRRRDSSSSSDDHPPTKKKTTSRKYYQTKKLAVKAHAKKTSSLKDHSSRAITPLSLGGKRSTSPLKTSQKVQPKKALLKEKHHGLLMKDRSRDTKDRELHREKDKIRMHSKDRVRSRSPVKLRGKSRSPRRNSREMKRKSHEKRISPSKVRGVLRRDRSIDRAVKEPRRHEPTSLLKERERRDKERADREAARNKERAEALARCQERQRERERLAKEKEISEREKTERGKHGDRLLPRPAERAMALAASRGESHEKGERERPRSHGRSNLRAGDFSDRTSYDGRPGGDRRYHDSPTLRRDREERHVDRSREHEYMIVKNRSDGRMDARTSLGYDGTRRGAREDHEMYSDAPVEGRYETHDDRHMSHDYTSTRGQYGSGQMHRDHEWERGMDQGRDRMYDRQTDLVQSNRPPLQNEWERNEMNMSGVSGAMNRTGDSYAEGGEWKMNERQWEDPGVGKPVGNWQGGMKDESWEGYQDRDTWIDRQRDVPEGGRRWQGRRTSHQMMPSGDNDGRAESYRRPTHGHSHMSQMQNDHINPMGGNPSGGFHHNQGIRHIQQSHSGSSDMIVGMGVKDYGSQISTQTHYTQQNQVPMQSPLKRPRMSEETGGMMSGMGQRVVDQNPPLLDTSTRKLGKISNISEEAIEDNLSEISDDADDILNSVENITEFKNEENQEAGIADTRKVSEGPKNAPESLDESKDDGGEKIIKDIQDDFNLGFEEISDGELEEEARVKGLGDALGVDWTSLVTESRARDQANQSDATSVRQKWKHHEILLNLGISTKMAGKEFTQALLERAKQAAREESGGDKGVEKNGNGGKELGENETNQAQSEVIPHHVADVQVAQRKARDRRTRLISQAPGCFSRALNARRDLQIRRQLCGFPIQEVHYCSVNPELNVLAVQLFKKATSLAI